MQTDERDDPDYWMGSEKTPTEELQELVKRVHTQQSTTRIEMRRIKNLVYLVLWVSLACAGRVFGFF
ncbi:hypothetical protein J3R80_05855 [Aliiroseovarius sp. Z3]|uniref:hypothetical protein n=1 Tax=Aliiroseovarius sp. Z3 TaxID=2811402 RepID=UPI0023B20E46|nr:hypothetical protein [Aliiroseovarius sp. Z3]MDE9449991.1 hypothetical protein [Aliiroseovarius sp. Z3]